MIGRVQQSTTQSLDRELSSRSRANFRRLLPRSITLFSVVMLYDLSRFLKASVS